MHLKISNDGGKKYSHLVAVIAAYVKYFLHNVDCLLVMATSSQNMYLSQYSLALPRPTGGRLKRTKKRNKCRLCPCRDHQLAAARTQLTAESLQEFTSVAEYLAHRALVGLPEDFIHG
jgi:hypothetical protein